MNEIKQVKQKENSVSRHFAKIPAFCGYGNWYFVVFQRAILISLALFRPARSERKTFFAAIEWKKENVIYLIRSRPNLFYIRTGR